MRGSKLDAIVVNAIRIIRGNPHNDHLLPTYMAIFAAQKRYRLISVTNNFGQPMDGIPESESAFLGWNSNEGLTSSVIRTLFDDYIDSSEVGLR